jgi:hypothetical protein
LKEIHGFFKAWRCLRQSLTDLTDFQNALNDKFDSLLLSSLCEEAYYCISDTMINSEARDAERK